MTPYFLIYLLSYFNIIQERLFTKKTSIFVSLTFFVVLILFAGTRNEVGGDWNNYYNFFMSFETKSFSILQVDFLFSFVNYVFYNLGLNVYVLNSFTALVSIILIVKYSQNFYNPKLAILISIPYIIIVVLMGYNRQGIALCILMFSINYFKEKKYLQFILLVITASLFHYSSLFYLLFVLIFIKNKLKLLINFILFTFLIILTLFIFQYDYYLFRVFNFFNTKYYFYIADGNYFASTGIYYRLFINLIPSIILIIFYKKFDSNNNEKKLYLVFSLLTILVLHIASLGSTFVDRLFIFLYPLQLYVYSNYNYYISYRSHNFFIFFIFIFYFIILYVYLVYGLYSSEWIPYKSILLDG